GIRADAESERHFLRASALSPQMSDPHFFYGRWLEGIGRTPEAVGQLETAVRVNPFSFDSRHLLMTIYSRQRNWNALDNLARDTQRIAPQDEMAAQMLSQNGNRAARVEAVPVQPVATGPLQAVATAPGPAEQLLDLSHQLYQKGRYEESIAAAQKAL